MKAFVSILFIFVFQLSVISQECMSSEYLKKGTQWEVSNFDKKGKLSSTTKYDVLNASHSGGKSSWEIKVAVFDKKDEALNEGATEIICENGIYKMDMGQMIPSETMQSIQSMEVEMEGTTINFPTSKDVNTKLEDAEITITAATSGMIIMNMKLTITERKIEGLESITTEAGTFECLKITEKSQIENKMFNRTYTTVSWFLPGFGVVRSESYDHKDKLMGSSELSAITR
ncbi:MAG TPA: hypothetical protein VFD77_06900 [Brumimicrobium sp.]|nr:hypothetical protein [Brumimicrobium sp.]